MIMRRSYLSENFRATDLFETTTISGRLALRKILEKQVVKIWSGLNWLRIGSNYGPL
jgi:hypothetical protein